MAQAARVAALAALEKENAAALRQASEEIGALKAAIAREQEAVRQHKMKLAEAEAQTQKQAEQLQGIVATLEATHLHTLGARDEQQRQALEQAAHDARAFAESELEALRSALQRSVEELESHQTAAQRREDELRQEQEAQRAQIEAETRARYDAHGAEQSQAL